MMLKRFLILALLFITPLAYSWDSAGHRLISTIAYANLTPAAKQKVDNLTAIADPGYPPLARFLYISTLPDIWRNQGQQGTRSWHFINQPWSSDGTSTQPTITPNLLTALQQNHAILIDSHASKTQQATALAFILHLVGDAHQPLHTVNYFSKQFPQGDQGGNAWRINNTYANNLHAYWDQSVRLMLPSLRRYPPSNTQIQRLARRLQQRYPRSSLPGYDDIIAKDWVQESLQLAIHSAYMLPIGNTPDSSYTNTTQQIAERQMVLAGYRLAAWLNGW